MDLSYFQKASGFLVEKLSRASLPDPLAHKSVVGFAKAFNIDMSEAEKDLSQYSTIADLFTRNLKPGARPLAQGIVHVADGVLSQAAPLQGESEPKLIQTKGIEYSAADLLQSAESAHKYAGGTFMTYYLCPRDYHRVHQPWGGVVTRVQHVPGYLWPVNHWGVSRIKNLFAVNERVVMEFQSPEGQFAVVMVGALNVGKITLQFDPKVGTRVEKGEQLGIFHLGSSVVVLYDRNFDIPPLQTPHAVKVRSSLGS